MRYRVKMDTDYHILSVQEIKDVEQKEKGFAPFPYSSFLKDNYSDCKTVTLSGGFPEIEVEADSEAEARRIAPIEILKKRIKDLEESLKRESTLYSDLAEKHKRITTHDRKVQTTFMDIIRKGELTVTNTGKRIVGSWFDAGGEKEFEIAFKGIPITFEHLVQEIEESRFKHDDCY
jgi:hypothetical protein